PVNLYTLSNAHGLRVRITNLGATVVSIETPDRNGTMADVVLGYDTLDGYMQNSPYFGVVVGRYGNRIVRGRFALDGRTYELAVNNGENHLHGGVRGFDKQVWTATPVTMPDGPSVQLEYVSADGEEGYPGTLTAQVVYTLTDRDELKIAYSATT